MKFVDLITEIEKVKNDKITENELMLLKKLWNACVDCIADEWPVLSDEIRKLKQERIF